MGSGRPNHPLAVKSPITEEMAAGAIALIEQTAASTETSPIDPKFRWTIRRTWTPPCHCGGIESGLSKPKRKKIANLFGSNAARSLVKDGRLPASTWLKSRGNHQSVLLDGRRNDLDPVDYLLRRTNHLLSSTTTPSPTFNKEWLKMARLQRTKQQHSQELQDVIAEAHQDYLEIVAFRYGN